MMFTLARRVLPILLLSMSSAALGMSGNPDDSLRCGQPEPYSFFAKIQCSVSDPQYIPPTASWEYPIAFLVPQSRGPHRIKILMSGYNARPYAFCTGLDYSSKDHIVIKSCAGHYPDLTMHGPEGQRPMGWWGWYKGPSNSLRLGLAISKAVQDMNGDVNAGITLEGGSYGGTGAILQSMMLRQVDPVWGNRVAIVRAEVPQTLFVKHWFNYPPIDIAWEGYDLEGADIRKQMANGAVKDVYYRVNGSPRDNSVIFDLEFFRLCDQYKIACFGTWHDYGHAPAEPGLNLPFGRLYTGDSMDVRMDEMLPVFTNSSANYWGQSRGHYNLGLEWHQGGYFWDHKDGVLVPIRYVAHRNIGKGVPDQPNKATFDVTIRRIKHLRTNVGDKIKWQLHGHASGQVTVTTPGEVTVPGLTLPDSQYWTALTLLPAGS